MDREKLKASPCLASAWQKSMHLETREELSSSLTAAICRGTQIQLCIVYGDIWMALYHILSYLSQMAPCILRCPFWRKFENLECEAHENRFFSIFLPVVCARKKICFSCNFLQILSLVQAQTTRRNFNCSMYTLCTGPESELQIKLLPYMRNYEAYIGNFIH